MNPGPDRGEPIEVDARGLRCPLPVIRLAEAARYAPPGTSVIVLASDPAARYDIPAWCRMRGHELIELTEASEPTQIGAPAGRDDADRDVAHRHVADRDDADRDDAEYLRFVVEIRAQRWSAGGTGSGRARSSRTR